MFDVVICAILKNESQYLDEWIAYHISIGFEHFFLYDNGSTDGSAYLLRRRNLSRYVTVIDWPDAPGQLSAYEHFLATFSRCACWVAFIDIDEFLLIRSDQNVKALVARYPDFSAVLINWLTFGSSGHGDRPTGLVISNFVRRTPKDFSNNNHVKTLARCERLLGTTENPHVFNVDGPVCNTGGLVIENSAFQPEVCHEHVVLCHYTTKSYIEWRDKVRRGKATTTDPYDSYPEHLFFRYDLEAQINDQRIAAFAPVVLSIMSQFEEDWRLLGDLILDYKNGLALVFLDTEKRLWIALVTARGSPRGRTTILSAHVTDDGRFANHVDAQIAVERYFQQFWGDGLAQGSVRAASPKLPSAVVNMPKATSSMRSVNRCVLHSKTPVRWGSLMIRYLVALQLRADEPKIDLSNFEMPHWKISHPSLSEAEVKLKLGLTMEQHVDFRRIAHLVNTGMVDWIDWHGYGQRIEYFPSRERCQKIFSHSEATAPILRFGSSHLVCPLRSEEDFESRRSGNVEIPASFYFDMAERMQLNPVFIGQLGDNPYTSSLHKLMPDATYISSQGPLWEFQTARSSTNIVVPVGTFAWLAAWLSEASQIILPVLGIFNPKQFPNIDLLPISDPRYQFYEFPLHSAVPIDRILEAHEELFGLWEYRRADYFRRL